MLESCPRCRYSLQGLPTEGRCPECGLAFDELSQSWKPRGIVRFLLPALSMSALCTFAAIRAYEHFWSVSWRPFYLLPTLCFALLAVYTARQYLLAHRGYYVASVLADGVYIRSSAANERIVPWDAIREVHYHDLPATVELVLHDNDAVMVHHVFATKKQAAPFIEAIKWGTARMGSAEAKV